VLVDAFFTINFAIDPSIQAAVMLLPAQTCRVSWLPAVRFKTPALALGSKS
jgi:energy-converting hydrogenase Eha subunit A